MRKENVFLVTGRQMVDGVPRGAIKTVVVCSVDDKSVRKLLGHKLPEFGVSTVTGLVPLENRARKIRSSLARTDTEWDVLVDPALEG